MANYSGITKPTVGGSTDTWGTELNAALDALDDGLDGTAAIAADLQEGAWMVGGTAVTSTAAEFNKLDGVTGNLLTDGQSDTLEAGFNVTDYDAGMKSSGTFTPDPLNGNHQFAVNGGAHTLAPPASSCTMVIHYTNNASAGDITASGFTITEGAFTSEDGDEFLCYITVINSKSFLAIKSLQ